MLLFLIFLKEILSSVLLNTVDWMYALDLIEIPMPLKYLL